MAEPAEEQLKPSIEVPVATAPVNEDSEPVTLTKGQLKGIFAELDALKGGFKKPKRVTERYAHLRFHEGQPVVFYGNIREKLEPTTGDKVAWMEIQTLDGVKHTVKYLDFLNESNSVQVQILSQKAEEKTISQGEFETKNPNPHFDKKFQPRNEEFTVTSYEYEAKVKVTEGPHEGTEYVLGVEALNR